jgi:signal transduction histidine kinase/HPt (histidine-containing phosphotransfer) domain-containing protein/AmiR/NasT family two-component response regulator
MANPEMFFSYMDPNDPVTSEMVPYIMAGNIYAADIGMYTEDWGGLISGVVPVFNEDGSVYCAAGVDLSDEIIIVQRGNMIVMRTVLLLALGFSLVASGIGIRFYRKKALQSDNANRAKSQFLSTMSHEIRTPMNAIIGISELVLREDMGPKIRDYLTRIKQAGVSLLSIINDILDFSKIEAGKLEVQPAPYALSSLLNDAATIISVRLYEKPIKFKINADSSLPGTLYGDEIRIRQVLLNILSNAVKYTKEGRIEFNVSGEARDIENITLKFEVSDTGIGIKEEDLENIFGNFVRFDAEKNRDVEGSGLGLAITYSLCRIMGGSVSVSSVYGKGSTFTVLLPQKIIDPEPLSANIAAYEDYNTGQTNSPVQFTAPDARLMIVDDISSNLLVAEGLLAPYKMIVDCCTGGAEAIGLAQKNYYDLIFMDHLMPGMDGIEATAKIRETTINPSAPIVALTANAVAGMKEMFLKNGFNDYLSKPIEISKLDEIVKTWIPREKQIKTTDAVTRAEFEGDAGLSIPGLDITMGINMTGGTIEGYRRVLASFCKDAAERLLKLAAVPAEGDLSAFVIHVHALKSAAATIGAPALSGEAAELEAAGKSGDMAVITEKLPAFYGHLKDTREKINAALAGGAQAPSSGSANNDGVSGLFLELKAAVEAKDIEAIDRITAELTGKGLDKETRETLDAISDLLLVSKFKAASAKLDELFEHGADEKNGKA